MKKEPTAPPLYPTLSDVNSTTAELPTDSAQEFRLKQIRDIRNQLESEAETRGRLRI